MVIDIPVIRDLALTDQHGRDGADLHQADPHSGAAVVHRRERVRGARRALAEDGQAARSRPGWARLGRPARTSPSGGGRWPRSAIALRARTWSPSRSASSCKIGDLDPGAPELRADSRYNRDVAYVTAHYGLSSDQFVVMVETPPEDGCKHYATLPMIDRLGAGAAPGRRACKTTASLADMMRFITAGPVEGNPQVADDSAQCRPCSTPPSTRSWSTGPELADPRCAVTPLIAYLADHKADTLARVCRCRRGSSPPSMRDPDPHSCSPPVRPASRRSPTSSCARPTAACWCCCIRRRGGAVLHHLPQLARGDRGADPAAHHLGPVRGADGLRWASASRSRRCR